jgi:hypothetical protein
MTGDASRLPAPPDLEAAREPEPEALRAEIARTRADLGETVGALAGKVDVKARTEEVVREARADLRARAREAADTAKQLATTAQQRLTALGKGPRIGAALVMAALLALAAGIAGRRQILQTRQTHRSAGRRR